MCVCVCVCVIVTPPHSLFGVLSRKESDGNLRAGLNFFCFSPATASFAFYAPPPLSKKNKLLFQNSIEEK